MAVFRRGNTWWYEFTFGGKRIRKSTKTRNQNLARQIEATHRVRLAKGEAGIHELLPATLLSLEQRIRTLETLLEIANSGPIEPGRIQEALTEAIAARFEDGEIYFVKADNRIKIGFAKLASSRFSNLQVANGTQLVSMLTIKGSKSTEYRLHSIFSKQHIRGEWFHASDTLMEFIRTRAAAVSREVGDNHGSLPTDV